MTFDWTAG